MTYPNQISTDQSNAATVVNEELATVAHVACYGKKASTTTGLTWGYYGGRWGGFSVADGTLSLTASSANYVVVAIATGVISVSTSATNWNDTDNYARVYKITTVAGSVTGTPEDHRAGPGGIGGGGPGGSSDAADVSIADAGTYFTGTDVEAALQEVGASLAGKASTSYVDAAIAGLSWKQAVRAATTAAGTLATSFENGDTIDGVTLATGDRILIKNQASASENGIYVVAASGAPARASDANSGAELVSASVYVSEGTTLADTQWTCTTNATISLGSTSIAFAQLSTGGTYAADGTTLQLSGSTFSVKDNGISYAKLQDVSATARVIGRKTGSAGDAEECTLSEVLDFIGSAAQGDILFRSSSGWARLGAGTSGQYLKTQGAGADPVWATVSGGSSVATKLSEASYTRPADTSAYASGDVLADSTSAATILTFTSIGASNGGGATLLGVTLIDSVSAATPPELELYLFDTAPTMQNDNVAWAPSDSEMEKCLGFVPLYRGLFKTCGANGIVDVDGLSKPIICAAGTTSIYGILVHRNSYTPTSGEKFTVRLRFSQG